MNSKDARNRLINKCNESGEGYHFKVWNPNLKVFQVYY